MLASCFKILTSGIGLNSSSDKQNKLEAGPSFP